MTDQPTAHDCTGTPIHIGDIVIHLGKPYVVMEIGDDGQMAFIQDPTLERRLGYCSWVRCSHVIVDESGRGEG